MTINDRSKQSSQPELNAARPDSELELNRVLIEQIASAQAELAERVVEECHAPAVGKAKGRLQAAGKGMPRSSTPSTFVSMTSTEAKNGFGRVLETVARNGTVLITRHDSPRAVVISYDRYQALTQSGDSELDQLEAEYDELIARMQTPEAVEGALKALRTSPEELGRIAVEAGLRRKNSH